MLKHIILIFALVTSSFGAAVEVKLGAVTKTTTINTNTYVLVSQVTSPGTTNSYIILAQNLIDVSVSDSSTVVGYIDGNRNKFYVTNINNDNIAAGANIDSSKLAAEVIVGSEIDSIGELETLLGSVNVILATEIDSIAELEAIVGSDLIILTEIDSQAEFEAKVGWTIGGGVGSGDDIFIDGGTITHPDFDSSDYIKWVIAGTNVTAYATNLLSQHIFDGTLTADDLGVDSVSASELNALGVEAELEAVLDLNELQGTLGTGQAATGFTLDTEWDTIGEIQTVTGVNIIISTEIDTLAELETLMAGINIIQSTEIDSITEIENLAGSVNILLNTEIDTSAEIRALVGDESGTGALLFEGGNGATLTVDASGFNGNLTTSDNTMQEIAQALDDLVAASSGNWVASGSTNSSLPGIAFAHQFQSTNGFVTVSGDGYIELAEVAAPSTPASGYARVYVKADGIVYGLDDAGTEIALNNLTESQMEALLDLQDLQGTLGTGQAATGFTLDTEWDTEAEVQTVWGSVNILLETEIDASSELRALMDDESGTGALLFANGDIAAGTATTPSANDNDTSIATTAYVQTELTAYASDSVVFSNKTVDEASNVISWTEYLPFVYPAAVDGTGATIVTNNYASLASGLTTFNGTGETNANYAWYYVGIVPRDFDSGTAWTLTDLNISVSGTDTDAIRLDIAFYQPASSGAAYPANWASASTPLELTSGTLTSPAANDAFFINNVTLTGWAGTLTAGRPLIIGIARVNNANDDSVTITSGMLSFKRTK